MNAKKTMSRDPVCGMPVDEAIALYEECNGKTIYFCSYFCRHEFLALTPGASLTERSESSRE
jgi:YHS domain-containing protein